MYAHVHPHVYGMSTQVLLDLLHAPEGTHLASLATLVGRIECLSHVLAWARFDEASDLRKLLKRYEQWAHTLVPGMAFEDFIAKLESHNNRRVREKINQIRDVQTGHRTIQEIEEYELEERRRPANAGEFDDFLASPPDGTPPELVRRGIYSQVAVALKGGAWREVSMRMLAQELVATEIDSVPAALPAPPSGHVLPVRWRRLQDVLRRRNAPRHTSTVGPLPVASPPLVQPLLRGGNGFAPIVLNSPCQDLEGDHALLPAAAGGELELAPRD